mmetsp:Transcript_73100/g.143013  ORF Transcript_73100/g.143013 Transcript_73100/m.143013 type:complete len:204 (+) Transcript_73100:274-885(+)
MNNIYDTSKTVLISNVRRSPRTLQRSRVGPRECTRARPTPQDQVSKPRPEVMDVADESLTKDAETSAPSLCTDSSSALSCASLATVAAAATSFCLLRNAAESACSVESNSWRERSQRALSSPSAFSARSFAALSFASSPPHRTACTFSSSSCILAAFASTACSPLRTRCSLTASSLACKVALSAASHSSAFASLAASRSAAPA